MCGKRVITSSYKRRRVKGEESGYDIVTKGGGGLEPKG